MEDGVEVQQMTQKECGGQGGRGHQNERQIRWQRQLGTNICSCRDGMKSSSKLQGTGFSRVVRIISQGRHQFL